MGVKWVKRMTGSINIQVRERVRGPALLRTVACHMFSAGAEGGDDTLNPLGLIQGC